MKKQCMYYFMRMKPFVLLTAMTVMLLPNGQPCEERIYEN